MIHSHFQYWCWVLLLVVSWRCNDVPSWGASGWRMIPSATPSPSRNNNIIQKKLDHCRASTIPVQSPSSPQPPVIENPRRRCPGWIEAATTALFWFGMVAVTPLPGYAVSGGGLDYAGIDISGQDFANGNYKGKDFTQGTTSRIGNLKYYLKKKKFSHHGNSHASFGNLRLMRLNLVNFL